MGCGWSGVLKDTSVFTMLPHLVQQTVNHLIKNILANVFWIQSVSAVQSLHLFCTLNAFKINKQFQLIKTPSTKSTRAFEVSKSTSQNVLISFRSLTCWYKWQYMNYFTNDPPQLFLTPSSLSSLLLYIFYPWPLEPVICRTPGKRFIGHALLWNKWSDPPCQRPTYLSPSVLAGSGTFILLTHLSRTWGGASHARQKVQAGLVTAWGLR